MEASAETPDTARKKSPKLLDRLNAFVESPKSWPIWIGAVALIALALILKPRLETDSYFPTTLPVQVFSDPPGASIFVNGIEIGKLTPSEIELTPEQLDMVYVRLSGYEQESVTKSVIEDVVQLQYVMKLSGSSPGR